MHVIVLGSAAGGGVPQWNCACDNCDEARRGGGVVPRTQDSLAVSVDGRRWVLLNASPDIRQQIDKCRYLWPSRGGHGQNRSRTSPIAAVVLTNGDLDHCLGLLSIREWTPLSLYATQHTYAGLVDGNSMLRTLQRQQPHLQHRPLSMGNRVSITDAGGIRTGLSVTAFPIAGKLPLHLEALQEPSTEGNVGLLLEQDYGTQRLAYVPGAGSIDDFPQRLSDVDCLFFDGTFWSDDELSRQQPNGKSAIEMAHLPVGGPHGSLQALSNLAVERRFFTHINNTNPMLRRGSAEWTRVHDQLWGLAEDGMELVW